MDAILQAERCAIPDRSYDFHFRGNLTEPIVDGGCLHPSEPGLRLATWEVVAAQTHQFHPISSGGVQATDRPLFVVRFGQHSLP